MKLLLFDVDGTLVLTGGAGMRSMARAFYDLFGVEDAMEGVSLAGRMDMAILSDVLTRAGIAYTPEARERFRSHYLPILAEEMVSPSKPPRAGSSHVNHVGPLPGVPALISALRDRDDVFLALLTGNFSQAAEIKLGHFGLWDAFVCGAFGEDAEHRHDLVPVAVSRAVAKGCPPVHPRDVIIIGDTPLDVACAKRAGIRALAVATGGFSVDDLARSGADHAVATLSETGAVVDWLTAS